MYFADRSTDGGLGVRLLVEGVITREQMHKATLQVSGVEHLGRMFERDTTIDRDAVELCVELMTDDVLTHVADTEVGAWKMQLYKRHPSGLDRWLPTRVEVITHLVEPAHLLPDDAAVTPGDGPRSRPHLTPPPIAEPARAPVAAPAAVAVAPVAEPPVVEAPVVEAPVVEAPVAEPAVVEVPLAVGPVALPPPITGEHALVPPPVEAAPHEEHRDDARVAHQEHVPDAPADPNDSGIHLADSAVDAIMNSAGIADEVADAVRRALAAIDVN